MGWVPFPLLIITTDQSGKWFTVITYPDENGIIPVETNSELGRGFKYDIVANHESVDFSKISVGLVSTKIYSSTSTISRNLKINIQKGSVVRPPLKYFKYNKSIKAGNEGNPLFYTNICYTLGEDRIPVKRSLYISNPIIYAVQMGFNVKEADFNPDNIELDSNGCLSVYEYKLETPNKAKILELTGINDFVKGSEVSVTGEYETPITLPEPEIPDYSKGDNDPSNDENISANDSSSGNGPNDNNTDEPKSNAAVIAGSVVAVIVVLGIVIGLLVFFLVIKKKKERSTSSSDENQNDEV
ncbi:hypothetical protein TRFO_33124 [Tritrichomonas foetus]|uniref:Uncharacterized protein n=1 Tax=Tritrichomonas foetus TaxID=1144522 RepID=A0A1J4JPC9_9EUKA|nr:hypothetical protein TRFO_33124 [Tritrichomonas foetus]|eukprot:OHT00248.1 hypothetical protein TRFO_33124 [Tritrichomonas foetus]